MTTTTASIVTTPKSGEDYDDSVKTILSSIQLRFQQMRVSSSTTTAAATTTTTANSDNAVVDAVNSSANDYEAASLSLYEDYTRILSVGEECINPNELLDLLIRQGRGSFQRTNHATDVATDDVINDAEKAIGFRLYDGFEPSGRMHIAQGIFKVHNVNKCTYRNNGGTFIFWIADWFALMKYVLSCVIVQLIVSFVLLPRIKGRMVAFDAHIFFILLLLFTPHPPSFLLLPPPPPTPTTTSQ
jgi:hypothetical protein